MLPIYMIRSLVFRQGELPSRKYPSIQRFCADAGYRKTFEQDVSRELGLGVDISVRIKPEWKVLPKRWIVERSLAWLNNSRRLSKDYEISVPSAQAVCIIAAFHTLLRRFSPIGTASKKVPCHFMKIELPQKIENEVGDGGWKS